MGRRPAELKPRKVVINGDQTRWEVRIPEELRKQEGSSTGRKVFVKEAEAKGYCNRLASNLRNYSDKARGLTDAQKIEAQEAFERLSEVPGARLGDAIDLYLAHLAQKTRSVTLEELGRRLVEERRAVGGRGAGERTLAEIEERWGRFGRAFPERLASSITPEDVHGWLVGLTDARTGEPLSLDTRHGYHRVLHTVFSYATAHVRRWVSENPCSAVELPAAIHGSEVCAPPACFRLLEDVQRRAGAPPRTVPMLTIRCMSDERWTELARVQKAAVELVRAGLHADAFALLCDTLKHDCPIRWLLSCRKLAAEDEEI